MSAQKSAPWWDFQRCGSMIVFVFSSLLLAGCTITMAPFPEPPQRQEEEQVVIPVTPSNHPAKTFSWVVIGNSVQGSSFTERIELEDVIVGFTFDDTFYDPDSTSSALSTELQRYKLTPADVKLEQALINDGTNTVPAATWTLYTANLSTQIVSPTFVLLNSAIASGVPYSVTAQQPLLNKDDANADCTKGLEAGLNCLRTYGIDNDSPNWLRRPPAFLLLSAPMDNETRYILLWFGISPSGQQANPPDGDAVVCQYCSTICDGQGPCRWLCRIIC